MSQSNSEGATQKSQKSQEKPSKRTPNEPSYSGGEYETFSGCIIHSEKDEYEVIGKLGQGAFATVWLVRDKTGKEYAMKIVKSKSNYTDAAKDENLILDHTKGIPNLAQIHGSFRIPDPKDDTGKLFHICIVMQNHGKNLLNMWKDKELFPKQNPNPNQCMPLVMIIRIIIQVLMGIINLNEVGIIHTDLKPENIVYTTSTDSDTGEINIHITIIDVGNGQYIDDLHKNSYIQTRQYRCPEVIIGLPYDQLADIWSIACIAFELATGGELLFEPHTAKNKSFDRDDDHLALMNELRRDTGDTSIQIPIEVLQTGEYYSSLFDANTANLKRITTFRFWCLEDVLKDKYNFDVKESKLFADLLMPMLAMNPADRIDAHTALKQWQDSLAAFLI